MSSAAENGEYTLNGGAECRRWRYIIYVEMGWFWRGKIRGNYFGESRKQTRFLVGISTLGYFGAYQVNYYLMIFGFLLSSFF
jgi:hypothetical protein